jgi:hypothetical protein
MFRLVTSARWKRKNNKKASWAPHKTAPLFLTIEIIIMTTTYSTPVNIEPSAVNPEPKKCIELVRFIDTAKVTRNEEVAISTKICANHWDHVRLVIKGNLDEFDTIAVWDDNSRESPSLYLGYWNDGVVA